jgi:hypothetical protein
MIRAPAPRKTRVDQNPGARPFHGGLVERADACIIVAIGIGVFVAIYAMTLNPDDATTTIGLPP